MGENMYLQSVLFARPDNILVRVTDDSYLCKYFMFLIIASANTLTVSGQKKIEDAVTVLLRLIKSLILSKRLFRS